MSRDKSLLILILYDVALINIATILAFLVRFSGRIPAVNFRAYMEIASWITLIRILTFYFVGLYEKEDEASAFDIFYSVFLAVTVGSVIIVALSFYLRSLPFPRSVFVISWTFNILLISAWHSYLFYTKGRRASPKRFLVIGGSKKGEEVIREIKRRPFPKGEVVDWVGSKNKEGRKCDLTNLIRVVEERKVSEVIIVDSNLGRKDILNVIVNSEAKGINVWMIPGLYEVMMGRVELGHLGDIPLIKLKGEPLTQRDKVVKRGVDLIFSLLIFLLFLPLIFLISVIIKLDSKGPVLYKQKRVGKKGKVYDMYKFRSMYEGAEVETGPVLAKENDERITKVGNFLRRPHLDELPQFFNILKGEMSLVGPRPERPEFVEEFRGTIPGYSRRFAVNPGITGLAQLYGRYDTSAETKLKYDLAYINNWSLGLDLKIFFMSIEIILTRRA